MKLSHFRDYYINPNCIVNTVNATYISIALQILKIDIIFEINAKN